MKKTESISREFCGGKKISLSVSIEADDDGFSEDEQRKTISEFGIMVQLLLTELEKAIRCPESTTARLPDGNEIKKHFGIDEASEISVFDSKKLTRMLVALSFYTYNSPVQLAIDFDPDFPWAVLRKKDISNS